MTRGPSMRDAMAPLLLLLVLAWFLREGWVQHPQVDDAYISYRYARNFAEGNGLVYNIGERVEGFSNLLWTLLIAVGLVLGWSAPDAAHALGLASGATALIAAFVYASARFDRSQRWIAAIAPALLLSWIGFPVWTHSGLETPMFAASAAIALAADVHGRIGMATVASMVATLIRPEGPLLAAVILGKNLLTGPAPVRRQALGWGVPYAAMLAALGALRFYYYGALVPNTYYAKVGSNMPLNGMGDLSRFLFGSPLVLLLPAAWATWRDPACRAGALWCVATGFYIVSVGGDAFQYHRFWVAVYLVLAVLATRALMLKRRMEVGWVRELPFWILLFAAFAWSLFSMRPVIPLLLILISGALVGFWGRLPRFAAACTCVIAAMSLLWLAAPWLDDDTFRHRNTTLMKLMDGPPPPDSPSRMRGALAVVNAASSGKSRSEALRKTLQARRAHLRRVGAAARRISERRRDGEGIDLVAATAIGKFGYDLRIPILDLLGLVDSHIARSPIRKPSQPVLWVPGHMRTDADYVFSRKPDYIFLSRAWSKGTLRLPVHDDVWSHPALDRDYEWDETMNAYRRRRGGDPDSAATETASDLAPTQ